MQAQNNNISVFIGTKDVREKKEVTAPPAIQANLEK